MSMAFTDVAFLRTIYMKIKFLLQFLHIVYCNVLNKPGHRQRCFILAHEYDLAAGVTIFSLFFCENVNKKPEVHTVSCEST